ncbi:Serine/threonine-protein kinase PknH [Thalassoglobus neptunius]|uniref:Serine/threonine-protein kinase PknH n=1 Tax=Thalassoglobus neptunius TaxID=1938619 RepID=A0A5C5VPR8_9PLAN|nr:serine/threonine-protein kinase [Thalassoglobus neptunius]TWT39801.1 Serine/threonine-protein kinase PknH [Thalassoglobus neptunius]
MSDHPGTQNAPFGSVNTNPEQDGAVVRNGLQSIGPYQLIRELGRGAMGVVFEAEHNRLKRRVAVKILPKELATSADAYARFHREMEAIGQLEHPNIVLATDAGQVDGICYIAMQLVSGVDLDKVLSRKGRLPVGVACEVIRQVALGLQEISKHNIVHRDIKPSNLFLTENGTVKILDLGIASLRKDPASAEGDSSKLTMTDSFVGTPDYVAPEQIVSQGPIDSRADIYSLGCTLYHLLGGKAPFSGESYMSFPAKLIGHMEHAPEPMRLESDLPKEISAVIEKMMAKNREDRFRHAKQVAEALEPFCDPEALHNLAGATESTPKRRIPTPIKSRSNSRPIVISIAVTTVSLIGLFLLAPLINPPDQQADSDSEQESQSIVENPNTPEPSQKQFPQPSPSTTSVDEVLPEEEQADLRTTETTPREEDTTTNKQDVRTEPLIADDGDRQSVTNSPSDSQNAVAAETASEDAEPITPELVRNGANTNIADKTGDMPSNVTKEMTTNDVDKTTQENVIRPDKSLAVIAESSKSVAESTEKIALTLDQMQKRFGDFSKQVNDDPQSPAEWYANAIILARSGNQLEARRAYLSFFACNLNVVDPYASFARLLRLQEGTAGARETFGEIPGDRTIPARRLVEISLQPRELQRDLLEKLVEEVPDFGPAYLPLGNSRVGTHFGSLSLLDQLTAKTTFENYLEAHKQGKVLKYYLDQSLVAETLQDAQLQLNGMTHITQHVVNNPVSILSKSSYAEERWELYLQFAEGVLEPEFRIHSDDDFTAIKIPDRPNPAQIRARAQGLNDQFPSFADLNLVRAVEIEFVADKEDFALEVKYLDRNQIPRGPFTVDFDPKTAAIELAYFFLEMGDPEEDWVSIRNWYDDYEIWFTGLLQHSYKAVKEVRYGINVEKPNQTLPIPTDHYGKATKNQYFIEVKIPVRFVTLQVTTIDGKKSPVYRYVKEE